MKCPFCNSADTQVVDTRIADYEDAIRRRRRCTACDKRFTTMERIELAMPVIVKRNGSRVDFDAARLRASMALALRKRPVSASALDSCVARIREALITSGQREIGTGQIGELVMAQLRSLDQVAYVRFASVYRSFQDIREFVSTIDEFHSSPNSDHHDPV